LISIRFAADAWLTEKLEGPTGKKGKFSVSERIGLKRLLDRNSPGELENPSYGFAETKRYQGAI